MTSAAGKVSLRPQPNLLRPMALDPLPEHPLVSILISNRNYAAFLKNAIESCLGQTYDNLEIIVCDDGSTDDSLQILKHYESVEKRIKVIYQHNGGQALALNSAFRESAGEIICLLDADDIFMEDKVKCVVDAFAVAPDSGFMVNRMLRVDRTGKCLGEIPLLRQLPSGWHGDNTFLIGPKILAGLPPTSGISLRRSIAKAIFPLPEDLKVYADIPFQVLAPMMTSIVAVQTPLSEYRMHGANAAAVSKYSAAHLQTLASFERERWRVWQGYLESSSESQPDISYATDEVPSLMAYACARFRSDPRSRVAYGLIPLDYLRTLPKFQQWYWRVSLFLPDWLFRTSFNFVYGHTRAKIVIGRILRACRNEPRY
ncbi:MAG: hypothetical protein DMG58_10020 [Acidobacteria bacterium]|nr:MAG: hypothetical protein DMG58_10020 [Acidobacteriota bacterium]